MNWEDALKKKWDITNPLRPPLVGSDYYGSSDDKEKQKRMKQKQKQISTEKYNKEKKCVVNPCDATQCKHNRKRQCMLPKITISHSGMCKQFTKIYKERY
jgi:hypothetical protein